MRDAFAKLWEFHTVYNCARSLTPALPDIETRDLRVKLLREEFNEYLEGEANDDIVEIADALADILYIALGTAVAYGIPLDEVFNEVHRSNMSKLDPDTGLPIYREDGKVLKGKNYSPPDIAGIIERVKLAAANGNTPAAE
jgi:predicted HAD superfamily Cof-like phosphohydrolase